MACSATPLAAPIRRLRKGTDMNTDQRIESIMRSKTTSHWLKDALRTSLQRDVGDAADDAAELLLILRAVSNDLLTRHTCSHATPHCRGV